MVMATTRRKLDRSLADFTETLGAKGNKRLCHVKIPVNYRMNKQDLTESFKIVGMSYYKEYEFVPNHIECIESYARFTTHWQGSVIPMLTPFAIMEHCQMQQTGNRHAPYLNLN